MTTTDTIANDTGLLAAKRGALDKAQKKVEAAAAEAQRLANELHQTESRFFGRFYEAATLNDSLADTETTIARMRNSIPKIPEPGCDIVQFLADLPPQRLAEMAGTHLHVTLPGIAALEKVRDLQLRRFEEAADAVESYAAEVGIHPSLVEQFKTWRTLPTDARANPTRRPSFQR